MEILTLLSLIPAKRIAPIHDLKFSGPRSVAKLTNPLRWLSHAPAELAEASYTLYPQHKSVNCFKKVKERRSNLEHHEARRCSDGLVIDMRPV